MWLRCSTRPITGPLRAFSLRSARLEFQFRYSLRSSNIPGASGCQMPRSGNTSGSATTTAARSAPSPEPPRGKTYLSASINRKLRRLSGVPPSQYWKLSMKERASCAFSTGRYFRTVGKVLSSFNIASWKPAPPASLRFFMKLAMALLLWPSWAIEKVPSLFSRITSGMEGNTTAALSRSRCGATASTTFWARSSMNISEAINTSAAATSAWKSA